jgi:hypothetical protein
VAGDTGVQKAAEAIARRFAELGIDYAIVGAIALGVHGVVRLTVDVHVLIRREDLARFKAEWLGRGYVEVFPGSKAVRDTEHNVKVDFLLTGEYPGDGKPKPVSLPDPKDVRIVGERFQAVSLFAFVQMKIASGMTAPHRARISWTCSASSGRPACRATLAGGSIPTSAPKSMRFGSWPNTRKRTTKPLMRRRRRAPKPVLSEALVFEDPYRQEWLALSPEERIRRSWRLRSRLRDLEAYHDAKTFPKL